MTENVTRILWTSNIDLPAAAVELGLPATPFGGWLSLMTGRLAGLPMFEIGVAMRSDSPEFRRVEVDGITYYALPQQRDRFDVSQSDVDQVLADFRPDILHVEGAEMRHARRFLSTWQGPRLLSMQGVLNGIRPYQLGQLPIARMLLPTKPRHTLVALALIANYWRNFVPRLKSEREAMQLSDHILGRTLWDQAQAARLAPHAQYRKCSRILRDAFYSRTWEPEAAEPFSIFMGNASVPLKGAHFAVEAFSLLLERFPEASLYISGGDPRLQSRRSPKRYVGYSVYLLDRIRDLGLEKRVHFTGVLSTEQMVDRMARSHVCLTASVIENSPNTLGEAMMLGVPTVTSFAGGAPSMASDEIEALHYRANDPAMLAFQIGRIFKDPDLAKRLSKAARARALETHDPEKNLADLVSVYQSIMAEQPGARA